MDRHPGRAVHLDGNPCISSKSTCCFYKPKGVITSHRRPGRRRRYELPRPDVLGPVGRLDKKHPGAALTNDTEFATTLRSLVSSAEDVPGESQYAVAMK